MPPRPVARHEGLEPHGGNREAAARRLGCRPEQVLDASASLVPFGPPPAVARALRGALKGSGGLALRDYPDRSYRDLRGAISRHHGLDPAWVLPGNGAAELFTWAGRDAASSGISLLPRPGFSDYSRALACWDGRWDPLPLPLQWEGPFPAPFPASTATDRQTVLWVCNPHNPTGQLWSRPSLEPLLERFALVICDEAFLPLAPQGDDASLIPLLKCHPNLVVIRSLTKLFSIAGLRLGYALGHPDRLERWRRWRDPWPVNGLAAVVGRFLLEEQPALERWTRRVRQWVATEGSWMAKGLAHVPGITPLPSAANYLLVRSGPVEGPRSSLSPLRLALEQRHRILLRDCRSFDGLGESWLRIGLQGRRANRRILQALRTETTGLDPQGSFCLER